MDSAISAIDAVVLLLPADVWGWEKLRKSQRTFLEEIPETKPRSTRAQVLEKRGLRGWGTNDSRNFQTTTRRRIDSLFVS